jgi:hypothetical protein
MLEWLRQRSLSDVLALAGVVATLVVAVVGPIRRWLAGLVRAGLLRVGRPERRYASWFVGKWGQYENPYLADTENLDLSSTYVSLSVHGPGGVQETRTVATALLADRRAGNLIIEGAPGSGKTTLLKAYGVGVLRLRRRALGLGRRPRDVPFLVQLRKFARNAAQGDASLARFLVDEVLVSGAGMSRADAAEFLQFALEDGRALVMLDGLDEVTTEHYAAVLEAVHKFTTDRNPHRPTHLARLIVTCRRQNFLSLREEWVPVIARTVATVAPLRNSEIFGYLDKLRGKFKTADGPESFFQAVRASGTLDLHRVPLILAMSVGLYARKDFFEIPNSIAKLYQTMIEEMLDRQRFKRDPGGGALRFQVADKHRFLREFALETAVRSGGFGDFGRADLLAFARPLAPRLNAVADPEEFVAEIVERSGLLSDVSEAGRFVFAHRSIHEHLAAEELRLLPDGQATLLARATDPEWRQVIQFYATAQEQRGADEFLRELGTRNPTLAGHCLAGARPSDEVATAILDSLSTPDQAHPAATAGLRVPPAPNTADSVQLAALVAATMSPRQPVQSMAVARLEARLRANLRDLRAALSGDVDGMLPLLGSLAGSNAGQIAALVPAIVREIPDDPRLVEPLWRCLAAPGIEGQRDSCRVIVERLLTMAIDQDCFAELQRQESYTRAFLGPAVRWRAYPFDDGLPAGSNLVTLLAWAEHLYVRPIRPNRFFEAKQAGRLATVERDKRRTIGFSLFWPGRVLTSAAMGLSLVAAVIGLTVRRDGLRHPFGWWTMPVSLAAGVAAFGILLGLLVLGERAEKDSWTSRCLDVPDREDVGHISMTFKSENVRVALGWGGPALSVVGVGLAGLSPVWFVVAAVLWPLVLLWLPLLGVCSRSNRFYPYRPNPYIDAYDDPRSRHWLLSS